MKSRFERVLALICLCLFAAAARAACVPPAAIPVGALEEIWPAECLKDSRFLGTVGARLNREKRYAEAADTLERALMLDPDDVDAAVNYAIALAGVGDAASSLALIDELLARPVLAPDLRAALQAERATAAGAVWSGRALAGLRLGRDSNLLGAPNLTSLALTTSAGVFELPLSQAYVPQAAAYARMDVEGEARREHPDGEQWNFHASAHRRRSPELSAADYIQYAAVADYSDHKHGRGPFANLAVSHLRNTDGALYTVRGVSAGVGGPGPQRCIGRLGGALEERRYPVNSILDGRYTGATLAVACPHWLAWSGSFRLGREIARDDARPGGVQNQVELRLAAQYPAGRGVLLGDVQFGRYRDTRGYSPLLENGLTRTMRRETLVLEYRHPLGQHTHAALGGERVTQQSTLNLFNFRSQGFYLAVRMAW